MARPVPTVRPFVLIDTSILLNILNIPGFNQHFDEVDRQFRDLVSRDPKPALMLPLVVVLEAGNHVARIRDGRQRRQAAETIVQTVRRTIAGELPWTPIEPLEPETIAAWMDSFPDDAGRGLGLGDLAIVHDWLMARDRFPSYRVRIWSLDEHLQCYDR